MECDIRNKALLEWLNAISMPVTALIALPQDASTRRYFRLQSGHKFYVVMDAPPIPPLENIRAFVAIANALRTQGINTPEIIASDVDLGFLVLSDFGDHTLLQTLTMRNADQLYNAALETLASMQACRKITDWSLPHFNASFMQQEWVLHKEWFLTRFLKLNIDDQEIALDICYDKVVMSAVNSPQVFMHRDYHAGNLMVLPQGGIGVLDFQDAFIGPLTYDLASLLRDCYIAWPEAKVTEWALIYWSKLSQMKGLGDVSQQTFLRWFDLMSVQRHLKALITFSRKWVRDHDARYLKYMPQTLHYIERVSARYPELAALHAFIHHQIQPAIGGAIACAQ